MTAGRRRQGLWVLGAAVLAAWAVIGPYLQDRKDFRLWNPTLPRPVATGQWGHYEGARWRLVEAHVVRLTDLQRIRLRPDSQAVLVTLDVIADSGTRAAAMDSCRSVLRDRAGRTWDAEPLTLSRYRNPPYGRGCGTRLGEDFQRVQARPGRPFRFQQVYQLPRDVPLAGLRLELNLPQLQREPRGTYLEFTL